MIEIAGLRNDDKKHNLNEQRMEKQETTCHYLTMAARITKEAMALWPKCVTLLALPYGA